MEVPIPPYKVPALVSVETFAEELNDGIIRGDVITPYHIPNDWKETLEGWAGVVEVAPFKRHASFCKLWLASLLKIAVAFFFCTFFHLCLNLDVR
jgi:hypothetical protein